VRLSYGSSVNVLFELELTGSADILTQVLKLSEDTLIVPAQFVSEVVVVLSLVVDAPSSLLLQEMTVR